MLFIARLMCRLGLGTRHPLLHLPLPSVIISSTIYPSIPISSCFLPLSTYILFIKPSYRAKPRNIPTNPTTLKQFAQELLSTFGTDIGEVALQPSTGGTFVVELFTENAAGIADREAGNEVKILKHTLWDRKSEGGFPGLYFYFIPLPLPPLSRFILYLGSNIKLGKKIINQIF